MKLSASIMAHPDRAPLVGELKDALGEDVPVAWDDAGPASSRGDRAWNTARRAWEWFDPAADWHVLVQDDAAPCADFLAGLAAALEHLPERGVVSAYLGKGQTVSARWGRMAALADERGASWVRSYMLGWGVSIALPVALVPGMIEWCDRKAGVPDDMRVSRWAQRQGLDTWYTWPSLVDHRQVPSLSGHRHPRSAQRHHQGSALELDWTGPVVVDPIVTRRRGPRSAPTGTWRRAGAG